MLEVVTVKTSTKLALPVYIFFISFFFNFPPKIKTRKEKNVKKLNLCVIERYRTTKPKNRVTQ